MTKKKQPDLTLGCDPEIILAKNETIVPANTLIHFNRGTSGFGCDGHPATCELRPGHSTNLIELIAKTEMILKEAEVKFKLSASIDSILGGHWKLNEPIGGHIHFHQPSKIKQDSRPSNQFVNDLGHNLDFFLIDCLEELIGDKEEMQVRREATNYGKPFRETGVGHAIRYPREGDYRAEYRVPGSWVINPEVMCTYLFIAKATNLLTNQGLNREGLNILLRKTPARKRRESMAEAINSLADWALQTFEASEDLEIGASVTNDLLTKAMAQPINWKKDIREGWRL